MNFSYLLYFCVVYLSVVSTVRPMHVLLSFFVQ